MIVSISDDFDPDRIAQSGQCFRWQRAGEAGYRVLCGSQCLYVRAMGEGRYAFSCDAEAFEGFWRDYFDLDTDYAAIRRRIDPAADPFLARAAESQKGLRILRQPPWEALICFIISQNRNIPSICRSVEMLCAACEAPRTDALGRPWHPFPTPQRLASLSEDALRACRLGYRARYVSGAARAVSEGRLDLQALRRADLPTAMAALQTLLGVGSKVASCVCLFGLHHLDAFPRDVWIRRVLENEYPKGYPFERYFPYNGVYQQYMFAYYRH